MRPAILPSQVRSPAGLRSSLATAAPMRISPTPSPIRRDRTFLVCLRPLTARPWQYPAAASATRASCWRYSWRGRSPRLYVASSWHARLRRLRTPYLYSLQSHATAPVREAVRQRLPHRDRSLLTAFNPSAAVGLRITTAVLRLGASHVRVTPPLCAPGGRRACRAEVGGRGPRKRAVACSGRRGHLAHNDLVDTKQLWALTRTSPVRWHHARRSPRSVGSIDDTCT
jgi:hypothetical protein